MDTAGDGFFATFDRTLPGLRCAVALRESLHELALDSRIGLHAGECELRGERVSGVNVVVAARIMALGTANEIVVSDAVREAAAGSDFRFRDRGTYALKGVPGEWRLQLVDDSAS
jgi:class 3 adenylate cyclase